MRAAVVIALLLPIGLGGNRLLSSRYGLERDDAIARSTSSLAERGERVSPEALSKDQVERLVELREGIEVALGDRRLEDAYTMTEYALSIRSKENPWSGDLHYLRASAAFQIARQLGEISPQESRVYLERAARDFESAAEAYLRPGARTRYDIQRPGWYPFQQSLEFEGDRGYAFSQARRSIAQVERSLSTEEVP